MKTKSLLLGITLFMPLLAWAGNPSFSRTIEPLRQEVRDIRRDNQQHVIAKSICVLPYDNNCTYYRFDTYGNLLMRAYEGAKFIFEYDNQGYLIKETEYNYPEELSNSPEEERYIVRQASYKPGTVKATENYNTLMKAEEELSIEEQVNLRVQRRLKEENIKTPLETVGETAANVGMAMAFDYMKGEREAQERRDTIIKVSIIGGTAIFILLILAMTRKKTPTSTTTLDN